MQILFAYCSDTHDATAAPKEQKQLLFSTPDYVVFAVSLAIPVAIGLFFFFYKRKENTVENFLLGERSINFVAVALSILASLINGVFVIGIPAEMHYYGMELSLVVCGLGLSVIFVSHVYVPKYQKMFFTSAYEVIISCDFMGRLLVRQSTTCIIRAVILI